VGYNAESLDFLQKATKQARFLQRTCLDFFNRRKRRQLRVDFMAARQLQPSLSLLSSVRIETVEYSMGLGSSKISLGVNQLAKHLEIHL
jgi:hypothetical protein